MHTEDQDILIHWAPHETRVAVVEKGLVQELHVERVVNRSWVGNIYLGRVTRVLPGMQSAFVDVGLERAGFLHVADLLDAPAPQPGNSPGATAAKPIEHQIFEGQTLVVQVLKDPMGSKGARLTAKVSVAGRLLVFLPHDEHIGVSQKIADPAQRERLRERVAGLSQAAFEEALRRSSRDGLTPPSRPGGYILRTNAEDASDEALADDVAYLQRTWSDVRQRAHSLPAPACLYTDLNLMQRVLRDFCGPDTASIRVDSHLQFEALQAFGQTYTPGAVGRLQHYSGDRPIFDLYQIDEDVGRALGRRVELKSGGYLVVDQTEAMTTVDVNTGAFVGARRLEDTLFKTNLEAAGAIARQLRLRNSGGIIVLDFIDMQREEHREAVLRELRRHLARDRVKTFISGFSPLGLVEMTRKRTRDTLAHTLCEPCAVCQGRGQLKSARTVAYEILREVLREARQFDPERFEVLAHADVTELLLGEESQHLAGLSGFIGKPVAVQAHGVASLEEYEIVLV
ncbi:ribonuclease G [Amphibiibacter pelophylacis]|uniref:Ribonuclease G n=1 Tax=Amphibiibacter pelophylacis TaxID=1799477 RepID=A0ACC6NZN1_9BURK